MSWKTRFALMLMMSALCIPSALAQSTATPAPTEPAATVTLDAAATAEAVVPTVELLPTQALPTAISVEPQAAPTLTETEKESTVGALTLVHPTTWFLTVGPDGKTLLTNTDLQSLPANTQLPPDTVLAQIQVFSLSQLPPEMGVVERAVQIFQQIPVAADQPPPVISEVAVNSVVLGRADYSQPNNENIIYIRLLDADTFLLAVVGSITQGDVVKNDAVFQRAFASLRIETAAPFKAENATRYDGIEQSTSPEGFPQLGSADAPVKITEIGSFDCSACRSFHDLALPVLLERIQAGQVQYTYIPVYGTGHLPLGQRAAVAALCVAQQGKFWQYHDGLFDWQDFGTLAFMDSRLHNGAEALGLDTAAFDTCLNSTTPSPVLQASADFVKTLAAFNGTPTVFLNGVEINWSRLPTLIDEAINSTAATVEAGAVATAETVGPQMPTATATP